MSLKAALLACAAALCAAAVLASPPGGEQKPTPDARAMVEALANRNPVPAIDPDHRPVFAKNYNWPECSRAAHAFHALIDHAEDAWPEMVAHLNDNRYSITYDADSSSGYTRNWTVGDVCRKIIVGSLAGSYLQHVHTDKRSYYRLEKFLPDKRGSMIGKDILKAWCEERIAKRLYELQIEVCQWAVAEVEKGGFERVSKSERLEWIAAIKSEIERLKTSRRRSGSKALASRCRYTRATQANESQSDPVGVRRGSLHRRRAGGATRRQAEGGGAGGRPGNGRGAGEPESRTPHRPRLPRRARFRQELRLA